MLSSDSPSPEVTRSTRESPEDVARSTRESPEETTESALESPESPEETTKSALESPESPEETTKSSESNVGGGAAGRNPKYWTHPSIFNIWFSRWGCRDDRTSQKIFAVPVQPVLILTIKKYFSSRRMKSLNAVANKSLFGKGFGSFNLPSGSGVSEGNQPPGGFT